MLAMTVYLTACDTNMDPAPAPPAPIAATLNVPFTLAPGQRAELSAEHLTVTFHGVLEDSRCPIDMICMIAGDASIAVRAELTDRTPSDLALTLYDNPQPVYEGFGFDVQGLMPGRRSDRGIAPGDYRVTLLVDRP
jgi:hypothetical protein